MDSGCRGGRSGKVISRAAYWSEKKMSWKVVAQATLDGISAAVGASAVGVVGQIVTNVATTVVSCVLDGADFDGNREFWKDSIKK